LRDVGAAAVDGRDGDDFVAHGVQGKKIG
jgi:hypothetical protein